MAVYHVTGTCLVKYFAVGIYFCFKLEYVYQFSLWNVFFWVYFLGPLYFRRGLQIFLTADETIFWRVSYFVSQVRLTRVGFLECHKNLLVSVTYSGSFNPEEWAVSVVGWYYSNASYFLCGAWKFQPLRTGMWLSISNSQCSSQSLALNTLSVHNGGCCGRTYWAESDDGFSNCGRFQSDKDSETSEKRI
jgi:hypothetical protein